MYNIWYSGVWKVDTSHRSLSVPQKGRPPKVQNVITSGPNVRLSDESSYQITKGVNSNCCRCPLCVHCTLFVTLRSEIIFWAFFIVAFRRLYKGGLEHIQTPFRCYSMTRTEYTVYE